MTMHKTISRTTPWMLSLLIVGVLTLGFGFNAANADHGTGTGRIIPDPRGGIHPGNLWGASLLHGGVAFAPDGDPLVDNCLASGTLRRFDRQGVAPRSTPPSSTL